MKTTEESIIDFPKDGLSLAIWQKDENGNYVLRDDAAATIQKIVDWAQSTFKIPNMNVNITGSITSNTYSNSSDIDIHFSSDKFKKDKVDEFNKMFRDSFEKFAQQNPDVASINGLKTEIYMQPNHYQDLMSVGCYDFLNKRWLVGPEMQDLSFDPYSEYFTKSMKNIDDVIDDVRSTILNIYELAIGLIKTNDQNLKESLAKKLKPLVAKASKIYKELRSKRQHKSQPSSAEEALKNRDDKEWKIADASFKMLDKFGYLAILKACAQNVDRFDEDMSDIETAVKNIVATIGDKISAHALDDSEQMFIGKLLEVEQQNESVGSMLRLSAIAAMMSIGSFLPANALAKELSKAKKDSAMQQQRFTKDSPLVKAAIDNAAKENTMVGPMTKTNVVNAVAQVLWKEARGEGEDGLKAVGSVIINRTGNDPAYTIAVLKQREQFSCLNDYTGGWTDKTYRWFNPSVNELKNPESASIWKFCKDLALQIVDGKFKSTIGNRNSYLNMKKASKKSVDSWGKKCDLTIGHHKFGYLPEYNPKYVVPGTFDVRKKINKQNPMKPTTILVKHGDTLQKIAKDNKTTIANIMKLNPSLKNPNKISIGQKLRVA